MDIDCGELEADSLAKLNADPDLNSFLADTKGFKVDNVEDVGGLQNVCNDAHKMDVVGIYIAYDFRIISNGWYPAYRSYNYDTAYNYTRNDHPAFSNVTSIKWAQFQPLYRPVYWRTVQLYNQYTERKLRRRSVTDCHEASFGVYHHCLYKRTELNCTGDHQTFCDYVYNKFVGQCLVITERNPQAAKPLSDNCKNVSLLLDQWYPYTVTRE